MRRAFVAIHVVALALWIGSLGFSVALAGVLFASIGSPVCPACLKGWKEAREVVACATCGALEHAECAARIKGCALEHPGSHESHTLGPDVAPAGSALALSAWSRVKVASAEVPAARRLLWKLDRATAALADSEGRVPLAGSCFDLPRPAVGDALARSFDLSQALAIGCAVLALGTVVLSPPGGALRAMRAGALVLALGCAVWSVSLAGQIASKRLLRESFEGETVEQRADFGKTHGMSSVAGLGEIALVLVALTLATLKREVPEPPAS